MRPLRGCLVARGCALVAIVLSTGCFEEVPNSDPSMTDAMEDSGGPLEIGPPCDEDEPTVWQDPASGQCYRVSNDWVSWDVAQATCERDGAHLAIIETTAEQVFVSDILWAGTPDATIYEAWIGLSREGGGESFVWVDGTEPDPAQWEPGQPDEDLETACAYASEEDAWRWHDTECGRPMPYVCEWTPEED